jgi:hypothetical protein
MTVKEYKWYVVRKVVGDWRRVDSLKIREKICLDRNDYHNCPHNLKCDYNISTKTRI